MDEDERDDWSNSDTRISKGEKRFVAEPKSANRGTESTYAELNRFISTISQCFKLGTYC
jgi:hypothetical protein